MQSTSVQQLINRLALVSGEGSRGSSGAGRLPVNLLACVRKNATQPELSLKRHCYRNVK